VPTYFRLHPEGHDPQELLEPENQVSKPWGADEEGKPCDKCAGEGHSACPACKGTGRVIHTRRRGVSVFPDPDGLYRYMLRRDSDMEGSVLVELEGRESDDVDFDADEGALLVFPTKIVQTTDLDRRRIRELRSEVDEEAA
jgi:hypothetical protein